MASAGVFPPTPVYRARIESKFNRRTRRPYYRYVIISELGEDLFDGCAGDLKEANDSIKAHLRYLKEQQPVNRMPRGMAKLTKLFEA